ncbi:mRNA capping enzyme, beta chain protein [Pelomyxa schiedti]|nr:mRNA capping enzyme, beta chain protein [Pelomyxa schiedti]
MSGYSPPKRSRSPPQPAVYDDAEDPNGDSNDASAMHNNVIATENADNGTFYSEDDSDGSYDGEENEGATYPAEGVPMGGTEDTSSPQFNATAHPTTSQSASQFDYEPEFNTYNPEYNAAAGNANGVSVSSPSSPVPPTVTNSPPPSYPPQVQQQRPTIPQEPGQSQHTRTQVVNPSHTHAPENTAAASPSPPQSMNRSSPQQVVGRSVSSTTTPQRPGSSHQRPPPKQDGVTPTGPPRKKPATVPQQPGSHTNGFSLAQTMQSMQNMQNTAATVGRGKVEDRSSQIRELMNAFSASQGNCEVEVRLGHWDGHSFTPGVHDRGEFDFMQILMEQLVGCKEYAMSQSDDVTFLQPTEGRSEGRSNLRYVCDPATLAVRSVNEKRVVSNRVIQTALGYDMRISVSEETPQQDFPERPPEDCLSNRRRRRTTYTAKNSFWVVDMTEVESKKPNKEPTVSLEFEVEFTSEMVSQCNDNTPMSEKVSSSFWNFISQFLGQWMKFSDPHYFGDIAMQPVNSQATTEELRAQILSCFPSCPQATFPGAMPVNFTRMAFDWIQRKEYWVSEKTDGIRYFLMIYHGHVYFVSRKFEFLEVQFPRLAEVQKPNAGATILDGELVRNCKPGFFPWRAMFMVFDVLVYLGESQVSKVLRDRLEVIRQQMIEVQRVGLGDGPTNAQQPFLVAGKAFTEKRALGALFSQIEDHRHGKFFNDKGKRFHRTDGVIFAPNIAYVPFSNPTMFKWKYTTHWTIDFGLKPKKGKYYFTCKGGNQDVELRTANFPQTDWDFIQSLQPSPSIVECAFDVNSGLWSYRGSRTDKPHPNHISVVMDTLEVVAQNITKEELIYRTVCQPGTDDWAKQVHQHLSAIVLQQQQALHHAKMSQQAQHVQPSSHLQQSQTTRAPPTQVPPSQRY